MMRAMRRAGVSGEEFRGMLPMIAKSVGGVGDVVVRGVSHELFDGFDVLDSAACAGAGAVEGGSGAGEVELLDERPLLKETVDEAGVEDVAGSGGDGDRDVVGGIQVEVVAVPSDDAVGSEGGGGELAAVAVLDFAEGLL